MTKELSTKDLKVVEKESLKGSSSSMKPLSFNPFQKLGELNVRVHTQEPVEKVSEESTVLLRERE